MNKFFLPASISLFAIAIIVATLASSGLIKGVSKQNQQAEVKGEAISVTKSPTPTPTIEIKTEPTVYKQPVEQHIAPTAIPTPTPTIQKPDNSAKLNVIANQFKKIGDLNTQIVTYQILANDAANSYTCDPNDYAHIFNPYDRDVLYQKCLSDKSSLITTYTSQINGFKNQIRDINNQVQGIIATCSGSECNDYYWELARGFEAQGFIVK